MNEILQREDSAYEKGFRKPEEVIRLISGRMLVHRPRVELTLRPYFKQDHMALTPISQMAELDLEQTCPQARPGDIAYIRTWAMADRDCEAALTVAGNARIWLNGEQVYAGEGLEKPLSAVTGESDYTIVNVQLQKGKNDLLMRCPKGEHNWGLLLYIAYPRYPFRWTRDYLLSVRPTLPFAQTEGMEGFAHIGPLPADTDTRHLEEAIERGEIGYDDMLQLPSGGSIQWEPRWKEEALGSRVDFTEVYGDSEGCAYALSYVQSREGETYVLRLAVSGCARVFAAGKIYEVAAGKEMEIPIAGNGKEMEILVKLPRTGSGWWLDGTVRTENGEEVNCVPFVQIGKKKSARWIVTGPYVTEAGNPLLIPFAPEHEIQFQRPYPLGNYQHGFWRMPQSKTYIRPYRDGIFFGQWFYAVQVGLRCGIRC